MPLPTSAGCAVNLSSLLPDCFGLTKVGGLVPFFYFCRLTDIAGYTPAPAVAPATVSDGSIIGVTLKAMGQFHKAQGRKFQNSSSFELLVTSTGSTLWKHKVSAKLFESTQADRNLIAGLALAEDLVFFLPTNAGKVEVFGSTLGLKPTTGKGGSGVKLEDDSTLAFEFDGTERTTPPYFQAPDAVGPPALTGQPASIAYLDALVTN